MKSALFNSTFWQSEPVFLVFFTWVLRFGTANPY